MAAGIFHTKKLCGRLYSIEVDFYSKNEKNRSSSHTLGHLGVTYSLHLWLVGKLNVDFIVIIERFSLSLTVDTLWAEICRSRRFSKGCVTFGDYLTGKGASPTNECWCQKTRVIAVLCGTKISAVHHLVLSRYTRLTDGQNCDSSTVCCITCSRTVKLLIRNWYNLVEMCVQLWRQ